MFWCQLSSHTSQTQDEDRLAPITLEYGKEITDDLILQYYLVRGPEYGQCEFEN